jgi:circadian clock protein KaiC
MKPRVKTGISGVDKMLDGGIPAGNQVILAGGPGTGKTLMCFEFLYKGAKEGNSGVFISLEEDAENLIENVKSAFPSFTDIDKLIKEKKLVIFGASDTGVYVRRDADSSSYTFGKLVTEIESIVSSAHASRVALDSVSVMRLLIKDTLEYRNMTMNLVSALRRSGVTTLVTSELEIAEKSRLLFLPEFFLYDGIIVMYAGGAADTESRTLSLEVVKMRGSSHSFSTAPYEITPEGINVLFLAERG